MTDRIDADVFDIETGQKRPATAGAKTSPQSKRKRRVDGLILTHVEERVIEILEELHQGGGIIALARLNNVLYEWIYDRRFVGCVKDQTMRRYRSFTLLGSCLEELPNLYRDDEPRPADVARTLRCLARQHNRYWKKKGKK